jgi:hypothetical protein
VPTVIPRNATDTLPKTYVAWIRHVVYLVKFHDICTDRQSRMKISILTMKIRDSKLFMFALGFQIMHCVMFKSPKPEI